MSAATSTITRASSVAGRHRAESGVRADIQALRAVAMGAVVLYHLWPLRLTGGYVGVDIFFVISGFLITSNLLGELAASGRVRLWRFWARRMRRLTPAASLVLLAAVAGTLLVVPDYLWPQFLHEVVTSSLQVENWQLAHDAVDYLAEGNLASPSQHYWTLSVEEQFYVALPLLLIGCAALARWTRLPRRAVVLGLLVVVVVVSFAVCLVQTPSNPSLAYFSTLTRAWEFGAGSLLAWVGVSRRQHRVLPVVGLVLLLVVCLRFTGSTPFPGYAALLPVLGALLVLAFGRGSLVDRLGELPPVAFLGRISYSAYLWHWPLVVLVPYATTHPLSTLDKVLVAAATVLLAWGSTVLVEDPIRFRRALLAGRSPRVVAAAAAVMVAVTSGAALGGLALGQHRQTQQASRTASYESGRADCLGAQVMDPRHRDCRNPSLAGLLVPTVANAKLDDANASTGGACWGWAAKDVPKICRIGPATGYTKRFYAIGDSHNNTLIPLYEYLAAHENWRIDVSGVGGCYLSTARQAAVGNDASAYEGCRTFRAGTIRLAHEAPYDGFIVTHAATQGTVLPPAGTTQAQATVDGLVAGWDALPDKPIIAIRDNPAMLDSTLSCVAQHPDDAATACARSRKDALPPDYQAEAARRVPRAHVVDLSDFYCTSSSCSPVIGHVLVYRDRTHTTSTWMRSLAPYAAARIARALGLPAVTTP